MGLRFDSIFGISVTIPVLIPFYHLPGVHILIFSVEFEPKFIMNIYEPNMPFSFQPSNFRGNPNKFPWTPNILNFKDFLLKGFNYCV